MLTRPKAVALVACVWALTYLPHLGTFELKGEEGRRILPAVEMLEGGSWIVPRIGGRDYHNKPPGINWLVAGAFALTGSRAEWAARLPSVLLVGALAMTLVVTRGRWLPLRGRLAAALVFLTSLGTVEKGRLIEIEAPYLALTGLAIVLWLDAFSERRNRLWWWLPAGALLAFGNLIKGPFLVVPFVTTVFFVLLYERRLRELLRPSAWLGLAVFLAPGGVWFLLARAASSSGQMQATVSGQLAGRLRPLGGDYLQWPKNILESGVYLLPWTLLLPLAWMRRFTERIPAERRRVFLGLRWGLAVAFGLFCLVPGLLARYTLPVLPYAALCVGWVLSAHTRPLPTDRLWKVGVAAALVTACALLTAGVAGVHRGPWAWVALGVALAVTAAVLLRWEALRGGLRLTTATALAVMIFTMGFHALAVPFVPRYSWRRTAGMRIDAAVPAGRAVHVYRPGYQSFLYYVDRELQYVLSPEGIDASAPYLLISERQLADPAVAERLAGLEARTLAALRTEPRFRLLRLRRRP